MLSGNLVDFPLLGVLQMLLTSARTGRLHISGPLGGDLWIDSGRVVHATALGKNGEHALSVLAGLIEGDFHFEQGEEAPEHSVTLRRESILTRMLMDSDRWAALLPTFPDWSCPVRFTGGWSDHTRVTRRQYRALTTVGTGSLTEMASVSPLAPLDFLETLLPFWQAGKLEYTT